MSTPSSRPSISVIIPAFNEAQRLPATLATVMAYFQVLDWSEVELIVVDDGSADDTADRVRQAAAGHSCIRLVSYAENQGKGFAIQQGILAARMAYVLIYDADGATPITELERFLPLWAEHPQALLIGSRSLHQPNIRRKVSLHRQVIGRTFNALLKSLTPGIADTQCGFKGFPTPIAKAMVRRQTLKGFAYDVELLHIALHNRLRVVELPVNWENQAGSKVDLIRDSVRMFFDLFRISRNSLSGAYHLERMAPLPGMDPTPSPIKQRVR
jgi:dolichyl-phosphate beta-glucosyltransferase